MTTEVLPSHERDYISFSQLNVAASCGEAYRRKYVEAHPTERANIYALFGSAFHSAVEQFELAHADLFGEAYDDFTQAERDILWDKLADALMALTKREMRTQMEEHDLHEDDLIFYGKQNLEFFFTDKVPKTTRSYLEQRRNDQERGVTLLKDAFGQVAGALELACIATIGDYEHLAIIDQVLVDNLGRVFIRDIKTGEPKASDAVQLECYRLALQRCFGITAVYGQLLYVKRTEPYPQVVKFTLDDGDVDEMVMRLRRAVESDSLLVNGPMNGHCGICDFKEDCPWSSVRVRGIA